MTAAAARKLQKEIDNVLKKVDDGIGEFDEFWEQATSAANGQQKERLGEELKKSINKLQRLRAQMREWISQSSVPSASKDKLEDSRRKIEHDMQRFKEFERDLKTKAFSTCALAKADEFELEEAEKMKYQEWLTSTIQTLNDQLDTFEADLEVLGNKKSLSNDDKSRSAQLKTFQERHRWHIKKLEQVLRAVDNDALDLGEIAVIRESVDYYVESHEDDDYYHDEGLYDSFDLVEYEDKSVKPRSPTAEAAKDAAGGTPVSTKEEIKKGKEKEKTKKTDRKDKKKEEKDKKAANSTPSNINSGGGSTKSGGASPHIVAIDAKTSLLDQLDLDEVKVQEDQLLSEAEEFICKICQIHVVGCSPKLTSCSHLFCGDCIAQWFNQHPESQTWAQRARAAGPERVVPCPVCKQPLNEKKDLYPVCGVTSRSENLLLWRMLSSLKIMCANHAKVNSDGKCEWIGEYGSYQKHIKSCKNLPGAQPEVASPLHESQAPVHRPPPTVITLDPESEAGESSTAVSRLTTPATTPAMAARSPPTRVSPMPTPVMEPQQAPRLDLSATPIGAPAVDARSPLASSPVASSPQVRPSPAPSTAPSAIEASRTGASRVVSEARAPEASRSPTNAPLAPAPAERPMVGRTKPSEAEAEVAAAVAQAKTSPSSHDVKEGSGAMIVNAASSFEPTGSNMVQVQVGDRIQVLEQHNSGWTYCKNLTHGSAPGWVPSWISQAAPAPEPKQQVKAQAEESRLVKPKAAATTPSVPAPAAAPVVNGPASPPAPALASLKGSQVATAPAPALQASPAAEANSFIRATAPFSAATASQLSLAISDLVDIVERHSSGWTYGRKVSESGATDASQALEGWFPDWVISQQK